MTNNTTPSGADALDVAMSKACIHSWDQSQFTSCDCDAVHPMFSMAFEAGYRAAISAAQEALAEAAQAVPEGKVLVDRGALNMVINALRRDAAEGRVVRGEMADALLAAAPAAPQPAAQQGEIAWPAIPATVRMDVTMLAGYAEGSKSAEIVNTVRRVINWLNADRIAAQAHEAAPAPLLARIAELEAELEKTKAIFAASCNHAAVMEMDRDARRYRWLRKRWARDEYGWDVDPESLDAAIDAAMKEQGHG